MHLVSLTAAAIGLRWRRRSPIDVEANADMEAMSWRGPGRD
jgi:hypothetical protein